MVQDIYICCAPADEAVAQRLCGYLEDQNFGCWVAARDADAGIKWPDNVVDAIQACRFFVAVFSAAANDSGAVLREVAGAVGTGKLVIGFRTDGAELSESMGYYLRGTTWVDASGGPLELALDDVATLVRKLRKPSSDTVAITRRTVRSLWTGEETISRLGGAKGARGLNIVTAEKMKERAEDGGPLLTLDPAGSRWTAATAVLWVISGPQEGSFFHLVQSAEEATIGRSPEAEVYVADPLVSRRHAGLTVTRDAGQPAAMLVDFGSRNGSYVNGKRIPAGEPTLVRIGDKMTVGSTQLVLKEFK